MARPGHDLLGDSKVVLSLKAAKIPRCDTLQLTADGKTALCGTQGGTAQATVASAPKFIAYSLATGRSRVLYRLKGAWELGIADVLWASPDGSGLIGAVNAASLLPGFKGGGIGFRAVGVISKGTLKPLRFPLPDGIPFAGEIAF